MRVLYVIDSFAVGGTESSLLALVQARKWESAIAALYADGTLRPDFARAGAATFHLGLEKSWGLGDASRWLARVVQATKPDLVHTSLYRSGIVSRWVGLVSGVPVVDSFVSDSYGATRMNASGLRQRLRIRAIQGLDIALSRVPVLYVSNSEAIALSNASALGVPRDRIRVVHRGRDPAVFLRTEERRASARAELGLLGTVIAHVGRFVEAKDHATLIDAFVSLDRDAHLLLVGDGPLFSDVRARVRALGIEGRVTFAGPRRDVGAMLAAADVLAFPSRYEGWPGAVIEAMMARVPVVASDLPVHREIDAGAAALSFFPVGDARELARELRRLIDDPAAREALTDRASRRAQAFTLDAMVDGHGAVYAEALARVRDEERAP